MAALVASTARGVEPSVLGLVMGTLLVGVPALDTCLVIISRRRRGISILTGGQDHLTHRTQRRMLTARRVALVLGSVQALISALVIVATRESSATLVYILLAYVICAAAAIIGLEEALPHATPAQPASGVGAADAVSRRSTPWTRRVRAVALVILGLGAGISPFFSAYYDAGVWVPLGLVLTLAAAAVAIARSPRVTLPATLAFVGVAGLGLWSLLSTTWAHGVEEATVVVEHVADLCRCAAVGAGPGPQPA